MFDDIFTRGLSKTLQLGLLRISVYSTIQIQPGQFPTDACHGIKLHRISGNWIILRRSGQFWTPLGTTLTEILLLQNATRMFTSVNISEHASLPGGSTLANHQVRLFFYWWVNENHELKEHWHFYISEANYYIYICLSFVF